MKLWHCWTTLLAGACMATFVQAAEVKYYDVPRGAHPHDVAADPRPDGPVWYTAQGQGALGRLDPASGKVEQIALGRGSSPHGVIVGPDGAPWVTDSGLNAIVRVDPQTREVKRFQLPITDYTNLNTATFDKAGQLWFSANAIVRFNPLTERFDSFPSDKSGASVRQMLGRAGEAWGAESGNDRLVVVRH